MGSSAKKKKEKKKDFQKPKYKVGKAKAKPSNFTDTSFKSKAIVVGHQSLSAVAPDVVQQFKHNLSLATSKSDKQRQEALSYLTTQLSHHEPVNPVGTHAVLRKLLPLISDSSTPVRKQLLKLLRALPSEEVRPSTELALMYVRAGLTNLSADISGDTLNVMEWLLEAAGEELVSCPGGWVKTLNTFCAMTGWSVSKSKSSWTSGSRTNLRAKEGQAYARQISVLTRFLREGFYAEDTTASNPREHWDNLYRVSRDPNAFAYLNLTGSTRDEEGEMYPDRESRQTVFHRRFLEAVWKGVKQAKMEGGATGRVAVGLEEVIVDAMDGFEPSGAIGNQDLLGLW